MLEICLDKMRPEALVTLAGEAVHHVQADALQQMTCFSITDLHSVIFRVF